LSEAVYEAIARTLGELGVGAVFGLMGEETAKLTAALADRGEVPYYSTRHESAAVSAADGYARATGGLGVCLVSRGPGFTNALTALVAARKARTPLLALAADTAETDDPAPRRYPKHVEQSQIGAACGLRTIRLHEGADAVAELRAAARAALVGGVVLLNIPTNVFEESVSQQLMLDEAPAHDAPIPPRQPGAEDVAAIADLLSDAERPLILVGRGAVGGAGRGAIVDLLDVTGALVGTTVLAKDAFRSHPSNIGIVGGFSHGLAREALADVDGVLALGASLNNFTLGGGQVFRTARVFQVALDAGPTALADGPARLVAADAPTTARHVETELAARGVARTRAWDTIRESIAAYDVGDDFLDLSTDDRVDPRAAMCALDETLPDKRTVTVDGGHFSGFPSTYLSVPDPSDFAFCLDFSAVGLGFGTALGVAVAKPDYTNVLVIGDGGLLMTLTELDTVSREQLPLLIVVVNDAAYGAELHYLTLQGMPAETSLVMERDFGRIAAGFDIPAMSVHTVEQAREAGRRARTVSGPMLIDLHVNREVRARWLEELFSYGR
jgi:thiamine pyrophosphate-dependent acetolactate synthase large subunit-like protein